MGIIERPSLSLIHAIDHLRLSLPYTLTLPW